MGTKAHRTIGITGCTPGTGATHLALALSSYCASKLKQKTALLELHPRNELRYLLPEFTLPDAGDAGRERPCFSIHGIDCYPNIDSHDMPFLLNSGYSYLILDMGSIAETDGTEFLRCDCKLVLGSLAQWKIHYFESFFEKFQNLTNLGEGYYYLVQTGTSKEILDFSRLHHIYMQQIPFIQNPLSIKKELFTFFEALLAEW